jgi:hypothetical protein
MKLVLMNQCVEERLIVVRGIYGVNCIFLRYFLFCFFVKRRRKVVRLHGLSVSIQTFDLSANSKS